jgi:hypothetical protein
LFNANQYIMRKFVICIFIAIGMVIVLESFNTTPFGKRDGTEPGYTGSPGDSLKNCTVCHGGTPLNVEGWITSTVPATGFVPGQRYTITATNTEVGGTRFGFSISPQAPNGDLLGTMIITDTVATKLVGNDKYATYRTGGVDGVDSKTWTFDWIAPAANVNEVIFYGAFNSNFEGHKEGDQTYLSQLRLRREGTLNTDKLTSAPTFTISPNPVADYLTISTIAAEKVQKVTVVNMNGQTVLSVENPDGNQVDVSDLTKGIYHVLISSDKGHSQVSKLVKL